MYNLRKIGGIKCVGGKNKCVRIYRETGTPNLRWLVYTY